MDRATVCTPASRVPKRPVKTSTVMKRLNISAGIFIRSSRKGKAMTTSPKKLNSPETRNCGYCDSGTGAPANQPAKSTNESAMSLPRFGMLKLIGVTTSTTADESSRAIPARSRMSLVDSASSGSTINSDPVAKAVTRASRVVTRVSLKPIGVSAETSPGTTQKLSNRAMST